MPGRRRAPKLQLMSGVPEPCSDVPPTCAGCGDVIGVYEPIFHLLGLQVRKTSRAAEPAACRGDGLCYHADCYQAGPAPIE
jgi:hypothetical protein